MFVKVLVGSAGREGGDDALALAKLLAAPRAEFVVASTDHSVGHDLRRVADTEGADLVVIGQSGRCRIERGLPWSAVLSTLHGARCAVAIAPVGYAAQRASLKVIGVGYDGSEESELALLTARSLAGRYGSRVKVLAVSSLQSIPYGESIPLTWLAREQRAVEGELARLGGLSEAECEVTYGEPREELEELGRHVDLLIVGSRGYGSLRGLVEESVSSYLAQRVRCPLLVLPPHASEEDHSDARSDSLAFHV